MPERYYPFKQLENNNMFYNFVQYVNIHNMLTAWLQRFAWKYKVPRVDSLQFPFTTIIGGIL